ncbi:hypothetical protein ACKFKF_29795 [Phormidesmis sp. 146-12]
MTDTYQPTIKDFEERYNIARSNVNNRITGLKQKGYSMEPGKLEGKNVYNSEQVGLMDYLNDHIKSGGTIATFPTPENVASQDSRTLTYETQDKPAPRTKDAPTPTNFGGMVEAISNRVAELLQLRQPEPLHLPAPAPAAVADPLEKYRRLQEVADAGFLLSSSDLAALLDRKSMPGHEFERYGFKFCKAGRNGGETAWRIEKL